MIERDLKAVVEKDPNGTVRVLSPAVGRYSGIPVPGALLGSRSTVGFVTRLNRRQRIRLPADVTGRVARGQVTDGRHRVVAVEFGQILFELEPLELSGGDSVEGDGGAVDGRAAGAEGRVIVSPTDGVYYLRPAPDAEAFVAPGMTIKRGQPVGLVEVMKTFNQILFDDDVDEAEVVEVRCGDGAEVAAGDVLVVLK